MKRSRELLTFVSSLNQDQGFDGLVGDVQQPRTASRPAVGEGGVAGGSTIKGEMLKQVGKAIVPIAAPVAVAVAAQPLLLGVALGAAVLGAGFWVGRSAGQE